MARIEEMIAEDAVSFFSDRTSQVGRAAVMAALQTTLETIGRLAGDGSVTGCGLFP